MKMKPTPEINITAKPRCPGCGMSLVYEVKLGWFHRLINGIYPIRKFFCVSCMSGKYIWGQQLKKYL